MLTPASRNAGSLQETHLRGSDVERGDSRGSYTHRLNVNREHTRAASSHRGAPVERAGAYAHQKNRALRALISLALACLIYFPKENISNAAPHAHQAQRLPKASGKQATKPRAGAKPQVDAVQLGASSRGRLSSTPIPKELSVARHVKLTGGLLLGVTLDNAGKILGITYDNQLVQLSPQGKVEWEASTGDFSGTVPPIVNALGTRIVLTDGQELFGISPSGQRVFKLSFDAVFATNTHLVPLPDASVLVASSQYIYRISPQGKIQNVAELSGRISELFVSGGVIYALTTQGEIWAWRDPYPPRKLVHLSGQLRSGALRGERLLLSLNNNQIIEWDLSTNTKALRWQAPPEIQLASLFELPSGQTISSTFEGLLIRHDADWNETTRVSLEDSQIANNQRFATYILADKDGRALFARSRSNIGVFDVDGGITPVRGVECDHPLNLAEQRGAGFVLACSTGDIYFLKEKKQGEPSED